MNYYIKGDAAKAEQIKAAFERLGYDISWLEGCANPGVINIGVERNGAKYVVAETAEYIRDIIKTHPDYKELELPVEPKFKVGDWIVRGEGFVYEPSLITEIRDYYICELLNGERVTYTLNDVHKNFHLWTIADAKDGDVLMTVNIRSCPFIYRKTDYNNNLAYYYAGIDGNGNFCEGCLKRTLYHFGSVENVVPATKEQRDLLFAKMKETGYVCDAGKKELRKIKPHYDIDNFKPKQWVLVRDDDEWEWALTRFSYLSYGSASLFVCINGASFQQCIPFEDNEKLLGTTDMCDEQYINW